MYHVTEATEATEMLTNYNLTSSLRKTSSVYYAARYLESLQVKSFEPADTFIPPHLQRKMQARQAKAGIQNRKARTLVNTLKRYRPDFYEGSTQSVWHSVPVRRRSAVMVLLFEGDAGEIRVVLTKRSRQLKSFSGHVSFPGGKADSEHESEFDVARRETEEEIGLSRDNNVLLKKYGCQIRELATLPSYLARTFLAVAPCVGFIDWSSDSKRHIHELALNPGESSSIFSVPLADFLKPESPAAGTVGSCDISGVAGALCHQTECLKQSHIKTKWANIPWNLRSYVFPVHSEREVAWLKDIDDLSSPSENDDETHEDQEFDVRTRNCWGLTANILHDVAGLVYGANEGVIGEEHLIEALLRNGQVQAPTRTSFEKRIINNTKGCSFGEVLPSSELKRLQMLYNGTN